MILIIDNYDSFTHNLYQYLSELSSEPIQVVRNDRITVPEVQEMAPSRIVISPGPGRPEEAGCSVAVIRELAGTIPILGVCLGHQAIGYAFGAAIVAAKQIVHGKTQPIAVDGRGLFRSIDSPAVFTRYHSLVIDESTLPVELEVTARSDDGEIMGVRHRDYVLEGVQFHPESIASEAGKKLLRNFLHYRREPFVPKSTLLHLIAGRDLVFDQAVEMMEALTEGDLSDVHVAAFLVAIAAKGVVPEEIAGCASVLQRKRLPILSDQPTLDTCGTGGDELGTFNISSLSAVVAAAAGARVAKHGNRAISSRSGSADFYDALGIEINLRPDQATRLLNENGFAFLFAPLYHAAMRFAAPARKALGIKSIMNLLGPLANPAAADFQLIGVYDDALCRPMAEAAQLLGIKRCMVVYGLDGIDEVSVSAPTRVVSYGPTSAIDESMISPADFGIHGHQLTDLVIGDAKANAEEAMRILKGGGSPAVRDAVLLNAGAALHVYGIARDIHEGFGRAKRAVESGKALRGLLRTVELSRMIKAQG